MCGRYNIIPDADAWSAAFELTENDKIRVESLDANYNVTPSSLIPIVRSEEHEHLLSQVHWGLIPSWVKHKNSSYKMINARAESIREKPAFRKAFARQRCLIITNGFYEWKRQHGQKIAQPFLITAKDRKVFAFAGIWELWIDPNGGAQLYSSAIVTTAANRKMLRIHERMPVILAPDQYRSWLTGSADVAHELLNPCPENWLDIYPVSTYVNNPRNNDAKCLKRIN